MHIVSSRVLCLVERYCTSASEWRSDRKEWLRDFSCPLLTVVSFQWEHSAVHISVCLLFVTFGLLAMLSRQSVPARGAVSL